jgi:hypothetical protein
MALGARRRLIPLAERNLELWPEPDKLVLTGKTLDAFVSRQRAVVMYADGYSHTDIRDSTGIGEDEVRRLVKRCVTPFGNGEIFGFRALVSGTRIKEYERSTTVTHIKGGGKGGCAGALEHLFNRYPEVREKVHQLYFDQRGGASLPEASMPITTIHDHFKKQLRRLGLNEYDWPFNTENVGYQSLWNYLRNLRLENSQQAALSRSGVDAARRGAIGNGKKPLISCLRMFSFVQLDFHKIDAASVIVLKNDLGVELEVPVTRWHIGILAEEKSASVLGCFIALEMTPSGDSTLEVLDNALRPDEDDQFGSRNALVKDGKVLLRELMPELEYQSFAVLKVDNGWSNAAHDVVNNLMDTVGCAVNFGPVRAWWRRNLIEKIFQALTQKGLQRLPSTHGKGPGDPRSRDPNEMAIKFRILLSDLMSVIYRCIRDHNIEVNEGLEWGSPLETARAALSHPASGFFLQPLPKLTQKTMWMMMHIEEVTVRGNIKKNERPYFITDRCRYSNEKLGSSFWLIGKKLIIYIDRRRCRIVYATVKETGERLGLMNPPLRWAQSNCSWRDRKLLNRIGKASRLGLDRDDPIEEMKQIKVEAIRKKKKSERMRSSKNALDLAKLSQIKKDSKIKTEQIRTPSTPEKTAYVDSENLLTRQENSDPFGLLTFPEIVKARRKSL